MASDRQNAANRRNALKSTGPRTREGKAKSARNSLKHGLLAQPALLPDEDETEFSEFVEDWIRELEPVGVRENVLAEQIVMQAWSVRRFWRVEAGLFSYDRAKRDHRYFWDRVTASGRNGDVLEIGCEESQAEDMKGLEAASKAQRSEEVLLGAAFTNAAAHGDPFGKLSRYKTSGLNGLRRLMADFDELKAKRMGVQREDGGEEAASSSLAA